jgi:hypothetical protein
MPDGDCGHNILPRLARSDWNTQALPRCWEAKPHCSTQLPIAFIRYERWVDAHRHFLASESVKGYAHVVLPAQRLDRRQLLSTPDLLQMM